MNIISVNENPVQEVETVPVPRTSTAQKIRMLRAADEDFEWYPTTPEIIAAMEQDIMSYLKSHKNDYSSGWRGGRDKVKLSSDYDSSKKRLIIESFLDIGAGDGRVLEHFNATEKYGIEIASAQADDLIRKGIFLIGRNFWDVSLVEQNYGLVFCNPPYSEYATWVNKILYECNFEMLYLVIPVRWQNEPKVTKELMRYESAIVGEFDFSKADRAARGRVNLIRVNAPWVSNEFDKKEKAKHQQTLEDTFERWVRDNIADFEDRSPMDEYQDEVIEDVALKKTPIDQLIDEYENEKANLGAAFKAIGKLEPEIIKLMGQNKNSMLKIIRKAIEGLKSKYWRAAFENLEPVKERMTRRTRDRIFGEIQEFRKMDFNADNIYSIVIWIINNSNIGILDQIGDVFDELTTKEYIEKYTSNRHWKKSDWRHNRDNWKYKDLPDRWKLGLEYRIVVNAYFGQYSHDRYSIIDDFIIICKNLGFPIAAGQKPDYKAHQTAQDFFTEDGELAFTMRYYTGNKNAHLKINKKLLMKFNIEVAKIRKWMSEPDDVVDEYGIPKDEATRLWNSGLALIGNSDVQLLEYKEAI